MSDFLHKDYIKTFNVMIKDDVEDSLHKIMSFIPWPDKDTASSVFTVTNMRHSYFGKYYPLTSNDPGLLTLTERREDFWVDLIKRYAFTISEVPPEAICSIVTTGKYRAFDAIAENSNEQEIIKWASARSQSSTFESAHDKLLWVQGLIERDHLPALKSLLAHAPSLASLHDKKKRSLLFFAVNPETVTVLLEAGTDPSLKDEKGRSCMDYWVDKRVSKSSEMSTIISSSLGDSSAVESMLNKIKVFERTFTEDEENAYQDMCSPGWVYEGLFLGIERTWTAEDIWRFSEFGLCYNLARPQLPKGIHLGSAFFNHLIHETHNVIKALDHVRDLFPELSQKAHDPKRLKTGFDDMCDFMMSARTHDMSLDAPLIQELSPEDKKRGYINQGVSINNNIPLVLSGIPEERMDDFSKNMVYLFSHDKLPQSSHSEARLDAFMSFLASRPSKTPRSFAEACEKSRQDEGVKQMRFSHTWLNYISKTDFSTMDDAKARPQDYEGFVRAGLAMLGMSKIRDYRPADKVQDILAEMIQNGVPVQKVPVRWAKNYDKNLKSSVSKFIMEADLEGRRSKKKNLPPEEAPKVRRM